MGNWLLRGIAIIGLTAAIVLLVLVQPLPEPQSPTPLANRGSGAGDAVEELGAELQPTASPTTDATPTAALFTVTPSSTPRPTATPTPTPSPTLTSTPTPTSTGTPTPTLTPTPDFAASQVGASAAEGAGTDLVGRVEQHVYFSQITEREESYRVYLPPGYDQSDRRYPVLYLLHGWPYDEAHWDTLGVDEAADAGIVSGALPAFIIVMPGADPDGLYVNTSGGAQSFEEQLVNELMPHIDASFRTVQTREARAIGGISRGGVWALEIVFRHPDAFGTVGAHSPALSANRAPSAYDPFTLLKQPGVEALRIYLSAGDADWAWKSTKALHEALNEQGVANTFVVHPGGHSNALWAGHVAEYLAFYVVEW